MNPLDLIDRFVGLEVVVVGEAMLDSYASGHVDRLCREAPVPIVALADRVDVPGGAANAAIGMAALGARVRFLSAVGQDDAGTKLIALLDAAGVDTGHVARVPGRATMVKQRVSGNGQLLLRVDSGSEEDIDAVTQRRLIDALNGAWDGADAVVVSDYGYGIATAAVVDAVAQAQRRAPRVLVADAKDLRRWSSVGLTGAKPNYGEACKLAGLPALTGTIARVEQITQARDRLQVAIGADIVAVTLDIAGAVVFEGAHELYRTFTQPAADSHAAGAGDSFTGTLALALTAGAHAAVAADLASSAATACLAQPGTSICSAERLRDQVAGEAKLATPEQVAAQVAGWKADERRIVFTNGCFDIIHHGHISYLNRAKAMGDVLVVGLNSDRSVQRLKGPTRPINHEADRAAVLAALSSVDLVALFDEDTPASLIEAIRPELFVKGGDYTLETLPEAPLVKALGGEVKLLPFLADRSTTGIIDRIRSGRLDATG